VNYRLIALDVDGTLLNDRYELTERTKRTVRDVHEAGATIVLCTGRSPVNTLPLMEELGLEGTLITHNGAATISSGDRRIVHQFPFAVEQLAELVRYCRERKIHLDVCTPFRLYIETDLSEAEAAMYRKFMLEPDRLDDVLALGEAPVKFTVFGDKAAINRVEEDWRNMSLPLTVLRSGDYFIDIMHPEATKGNALKRLAESLGIERSQVMAIGNYYNDLEMIRFAGLGVAMENSPDEVKREADVVTASNNEDGVHLALSRYCLGR
jgi:Cof subfamily protein (haloacid dehalogenase superfamily)